MHGRGYSIVINQSVGAVMDLIEILAGTNKGFAILSASLTQETSESSEQLAIAIWRLSASGSGGGTAPTARALDENETQGFGGTIEVGNTTQGTRATTEPLLREGFNALSGWKYVPVPEERIDVSGGGRMAIALVAAPAIVTPLSMTLSMTVREY
jgi:hypothetical protein